MDNDLKHTANATLYDTYTVKILTDCNTKLLFSTKVVKIKVYAL